jgi:tripartite-type tricarboxylate transporter receptor subunit TctC
VPTPPGGSTDFTARLIAEPLTRALGQSVIVDNKPGGSGNIGNQFVARAKPDGYTLLMAYSGYQVGNPHLFKDTGWDPLKDFVPVAMVTRAPQVFAIHHAIPVNSLQELIAYAKKNPGKLNYGSAGNASAGHLAMEYLKLVTGMFITHIPYRGTGPQLTDLLAGRTQASSAGLPALGPYIRSGKLRAIAVGTSQRISTLPDVPTVAELGFKNFETSQWYGILAPAGTPAEVVKLLHEESLKALKSSAVTARFATDNAIAGGGPASEFASFIAEEQKVWSDIVKRAQIRAD